MIQQASAEKKPIYVHEKREDVSYIDRWTPTTQREVRWSVQFALRLLPFSSSVNLAQSAATATSVEVPSQHTWLFNTTKFELLVSKAYISSSGPSGSAILMPMRWILRPGCFAIPNVTHSILVFKGDILRSSFSIQTLIFSHRSTRRIIHFGRLLSQQSWSSNTRVQLFWYSCK
jgi:hypothetical protein